MRCPGPLPAWFIFDGDLVGLCTACTYHIRHHDSACGWLSRGRYCGVILCCSIRLVLFHFVAAPFGVGLCPTVSGGVICACSTAWVSTLVVFKRVGLVPVCCCTALVLCGSRLFALLCLCCFAQRMFCLLLVCYATAFVMPCSGALPLGLCGLFSSARRVLS